MADNRLIRSLFKLTGLLLGAAGLVCLLVAAVRIRNEQVCADVAIHFLGESGGKYVGRAEIAGQMWPGGVEALKNRALHDLDLGLMEKRIEQDPWVRNAEIFIDGNQRLQVEVEEHTPTARIFPLTGSSFYLDDDLRRIPLNRHHTPNLPVFTGIPLSQLGSARSDSTLLRSVRDIVRAIQADSFWLAQLEQCAYEPPLGFVLYPLAGEHRIIFGNADRAAEKFRNLFVFYAKVLATEGWNNYKTIDLRFHRQVVTVPTAPPRNKKDSLSNPSATLNALSSEPPIQGIDSDIPSNSQKNQSATSTNPRLVMPSRPRQR